MTLSKATSTVNESIRHHKLSSKEIQFSRDLVSNDNLQLDDSKIADTVTQHRIDNNPYSAKSKSRTKEPALRADAVEGQLVFHKQEGNKNTRRDLYMVLDKDTTNDTLTICKVRDAISNKGASIVPQDARYRYNVRQTDIVLAPNQPPPPKTYDTISSYAEPLVPHPVHQYPPQQYREVPHPPPSKESFPHANDEEDPDDEDQEIWSIPYPPAPTHHQDQPYQHQYLDAGPDLDDLSEHSDSFITIDELDTNTEDDDHNSSDNENRNISNTSDEDQNQDVNNTNSDEGSVDVSDHGHDERDSDDSDEQYQPPPDIVDITIPVGQVTHPSLPTKNKYIKFRRHPDCTVAEDLRVPADQWSFAQIIKSHKFDKYGRRWYDIRFDNEYVMGIYLSKICGGTRVNDLIWMMISEEQYNEHHGRHHHPLEQVDGQVITPESLTPDSNADIDDRPPSPAWDHLPDKLAEDGAVLWEEEPLHPLSPLHIRNAEL